MALVLLLVWQHMNDAVTSLENKIDPTTDALMENQEDKSAYF